MLGLSRSLLKPMARLLVLFLCLSLADLFLTWKLISLGDGQVLESNPVASWWLATYGWGGMVAFKLGMVLVIGTLVGTIAWRRPRTSELVLVFACGAQSTVVLYSLFLARLGDDPRYLLASEAAWLSSGVPEASPESDTPRSPRPGFLPPNGLFLLLGQKSVQEELKLSEAHTAAIDRLSSRRWELMQSGRRLSREEWNVRVEQLLTQEKGLIENLEPGQSARLRQIAWQQSGPFALTEAAVASALELTPEQKVTLRTLSEEAAQARAVAARSWGFGPGAPRRADEDRARTREQLLAVLTTDQAYRWKELTGEPFRGELRPIPGSVPVPGRDPRRAQRQ